MHVLGWIGLHVCNRCEGPNPAFERDHYLSLVATGLVRFVRLLGARYVTGRCVKIVDCGIDPRRALRGKTEKELQLPQFGLG